MERAQSPTPSSSVFRDWWNQCREMDGPGLDVFLDELEEDERLQLLQMIEDYRTLQNAVSLDVEQRSFRAEE